MAQKFNLTAQLQLQSPKNTNQVINEIRSKLKPIGVELKVASDTKKIAAANKELINVSKSAKQSERSISELNRALQESARRFSVITIATGTFLGFASAVKNSVKQSIEFEKELIRIKQVTQESSKFVKSLADEVSRLSTSLGVSSSDLLKASTTLAQAGFTAEQTKKSLDILAKTTLGPSFDDIQETTEGLIAILRQFGNEAVNSGREIKFLEGSLDAINSVSKEFAVESSDLIAAIRRTGGVFASAGGKVEELIALFTSVRATTRESAETIATGLRTIFTRIQRTDTVDQLKSLGVELRNSQGEFIGAFEAVKRLSEGLAFLDPRDYRYSDIIEELGGFRQVGKVIPLIQQFKIAQDALAVAQRAGGSVAEDAELAQQGLGNQIDKVRQKFDELIRKIAGTETFSSIATGAIKLAEAFIKVADSLAPLIPLITAFAAIKLGSGVAGAIGGVLGISQKARGAGPPTRFARGGLVPGTGNSDTVPAMLTPGEFVIKKSSVKKLGADKLAQMNENRYNDGGPISKLGGVGASKFKNIEGQEVGLKDDYYRMPKAEDYQVEISRSSWGKLKGGGSGWERWLAKQSLKKGKERPKGMPPGILRYQRATGYPIDLFGPNNKLFDAKDFPDRTNIGGKPNKSLNQALVEADIQDYNFTGARKRYYTYNNEPIGVSRTILKKGKDIIDLNPISYIYPKLVSQKGGETVPLTTREAIEDRKKRTAKKMASGGNISGSDTVPSLLTPGEFVINKQAAQRIGYGNLNRMNKQGVAKFAKGGAVGIQKFFRGGVAEQDVNRSQGYRVYSNVGEAESDLEKILNQIPIKLAESIKSGFQGIEAVAPGSSVQSIPGAEKFKTGTRGMAVAGGGKTAIGLQIKEGIGANTNTLVHEAGHLADKTLGGSKLASETPGTFQFDLVEKVKPQMEKAFIKAGKSAEEIDKYLASNAELFAEFFAKASPEVRKIITSTTDSKKGMVKLAQSLGDSGYTYAGLEASDLGVSAQSKKANVQKQLQKSSKAKPSASPSVQTKIASISREIPSLEKAASEASGVSSSLSQIRKKIEQRIVEAESSISALPQRKVGRYKRTEDPEAKKTRTELKTKLEEQKAKLEEVTIKQTKASEEELKAQKALTKAQEKRAELINKAKNQKVAGFEKIQRRQEIKKQNKAEKAEILSNRKRMQDPGYLKKVQESIYPPAPTNKIANFAKATPGFVSNIGSGAISGASGALDKTGNLVLLGATITSVTASFTGLNDATKEAINQSVAFASTFIGLSQSLFSTISAASAKAKETLSSEALAASKQKEVIASEAAAAADQREAAASNTAASKPPGAPGKGGQAPGPSKASARAQAFGGGAIAGVTVALSALQFFSARASALADEAKAKVDKGFEDVKNGLSVNAEEIKKAANEEVELRNRSGNLFSKSSIALASGAALTGAAIGSFAGPLGAAVGGLIGAGVGVAASFGLIESEWLSSITGIQQEREAREQATQAINNSIDSIISLNQAQATLSSNLERIDQSGLSSEEKLSRRLQEVQGIAAKATPEAAESTDELSGYAAKFGTTLSELTGATDDRIREIVEATKGVANVDAEVQKIKMAATQFDSSMSLLDKASKEAGTNFRLASDSLDIKNPESVDRFYAALNQSISAIEAKNKAEIEAAKQSVENARVVLDRLGNKQGEEREAAVKNLKRSQENLAKVQEQAARDIEIQQTSANSLVKVKIAEQEAIERTTKAQLAQYKALQAANNFAASLANASADLDNQSAAIDNFISAVNNQVSSFQASSVRGIEDPTKVQDLNRFNRELQLVVSQERNPEAARQAQELSNLASVFKQAETLIGTDISRSEIPVRDILKNAGITEGSVGKEIFGAIEKQISEQKGEITGQDLQNILSPLSEQIQAYSKNIQSVTENQNKEIQTYAKYLDAIDAVRQKELDARKKIADTQVRGFELRQQARGQELTPQQREMNRRFLSQSQLNAGAAGRGGVQLASGNVQQLRTQKDLAQAALQRIQAEKAAGNITVQRAKQLQVAERQYINIIKDAGDELERLADQSDRASEILGEIDKERAKRETLTKIIEEFVVGGDQERQAQVEAFAGIQNALMTGTLQGQTAEQRQATVGLLDRLEDIQIAGTGGLTGKEVKQELVFRDAIRMGLDPNVARQLATATSKEEKLIQALDRLTEEMVQAARARNNPNVQGPQPIFPSRGGFIQHKANGGAIYRQGGGSAFKPKGTDTVPAMLTPGEFVVSKSAVDKVGVGALNAINKGISYKANGGLTGFMDSIGAFLMGRMRKDREADADFLKKNKKEVDYFKNNVLFNPEFDRSLIDTLNKVNQTKLFGINNIPKNIFKDQSIESLLHENGIYYGQIYKDYAFKNSDLETATGKSIDYNAVGAAMRAMNEKSGMKTMDDLALSRRQIEEGRKQNSLIENEMIFLAEMEKFKSIPSKFEEIPKNYQEAYNQRSAKGETKLSKEEAYKYYMDNIYRNVSSYDQIKNQKAENDRIVKEATKARNEARDNRLEKTKQKLGGIGFDFSDKTPRSFYDIPEEFQKKYYNNLSSGKTSMSEDEAYSYYMKNKYGGSAPKSFSDIPEEFQKKYWDNFLSGKTSMSQDEAYRYYMKNYRGIKLYNEDLKPGEAALYRKNGGSIFKPKGTDTVPAMLTPGEFVVRKSAVDKIGVDTLSAINNGQALASGGVVYRQAGGAVPGGNQINAANFGAGQSIKLVTGDQFEKLVSEGIVKMGAAKFFNIVRASGAYPDLFNKENSNQRKAISESIKNGQIAQLTPLFTKELSNFLRNLEANVAFFGSLNSSGASFRLDLAGLSDTEASNKIVEYYKWQEGMKNSLDKFKASGKSKASMDILKSSYGIDVNSQLESFKNAIEADQKQMKNIFPNPADGVKVLDALKNNKQIISDIAGFQANLQKSGDISGVNRNSLDLIRSSGLFFNSGGQVPYFSSGGGVDSVPAMLTPGEFIMSTEAVRKHGIDKMKQLNKGKIPGFNKGGFVGGVQYRQNGGTVSDGGGMLSLDTSRVQGIFDNFIGNFSSIFDNITKVFGGVSESLNKLAQSFGGFTMQHTVTVEGLINLGGLNIDTIKNELSNSIGQMVAQEVTKRLDDQSNKFSAG